MGSGYIHGTGPEEQRRLSLLNELLNADSLRMLDLSPGQRVLDLGSGLGQLARAMARTVGEQGAVVGVEPSEAQRREAVRLASEAGEADLVDLRDGEASSVPLEEAEWAGFDVVHARFLLEHVEDPAGVVRAMVRAARPGGRIVLEDDDHAVLRMWPEPPGAARLWDAYIESYVLTGRDPFVGRRLVSLIREAGGRPLRNTWLFFGSCSGQEGFGVMVRNFVTILDQARDVMLGHRLLSVPELEDGLRELRAWGERDDAALWYARSWAEGRRPGDG